MNIKIDVEQFARDDKAGKSIGGKDGALGSLIKQLTEEKWGGFPSDNSLLKLLFIGI